MMDQTSFGKMPDGELVKQFCLTNSHNVSVEILNLGGIIRRWLIPKDKDKHNHTDIVLGFDTVDDYLSDDSYLGALIGRYSNRISKGKFNLKGIPPMAAGAAHIRVTFQVDADGLLNVKAMEKSTGVHTEIQVKPSYGLEDSEIADMLKASMDNAQDDMQSRMLKEQQVEAARVQENLQGALDSDGKTLLETSEIQAIEDGLTRLNELAKGTDKDAINAAIKQVDKLSETFAQKRMDQSIKSAFSGQSVDHI